MLRPAAAGHGRRRVSPLRLLLQLRSFVHVPPGSKSVLKAGDHAKPDPQLTHRRLHGVFRCLHAAATKLCQEILLLSSLSTAAAGAEHNQVLPSVPGHDVRGARSVRAPPRQIRQGRATDAQPHPRRRLPAPSAPSSSRSAPTPYPMFPRWLCTRSPSVTGKSRAEPCAAVGQDAQVRALLICLLLAVRQLASLPCSRRRSPPTAPTGVATLAGVHHRQRPPEWRRSPASLPGGGGWPRPEAPEQKNTRRPVPRWRRNPAGFGGEGIRRASAVVEDARPAADMEAVGAAMAAWVGEGDEATPSTSE